jgi:hypothetical protein
VDSEDISVNSVERSDIVVVEMVSFWFFVCRFVRDFSTRGLTTFQLLEKCS